MTASASASAWAEDHEPLDSPEALLRHLDQDHDVTEAHDLDPQSAPVQFWLRKHADLHESDHTPPATRRRPGARRAGSPTTTAAASAPPEVAGQARPPATSAAPPPPAAGKPTRPPAGVWAGRRWLARLLRAYLLAALLLVGLVLLVTPAPAAELPGYRMELNEQPLQGLAGVALHATAWATGQAAERQADLLSASPIDTRALTPAITSFAGWLHPHRLPVAVIATVLLAGLIAYGILARRGGRAWALGAALIVVGAVMVYFPAEILTAANAPGLTTSRQATNLAHDLHLFPANLDTARAETAQASLAEGYWTAFVTGSHSRLETQSTVLTKTPAEHRGEVVAFLHSRGVPQARGLHGAVISTNGLAAAAPFALAIGALSVLGTTAQSLLLVLLLAGPVVVLIGIVRRRPVAVVLWWGLPLLACVPLTAAATLGSIGLTRVAVAVAGSWELLTSLISGGVIALLTLGFVGWVARRRLRRWRHRHHQQTEAQAAEGTGELPAHESARTAGAA